MKKKFAFFIVLLVGLLGCLTLGACISGSGNRNENCTHPDAKSSVTQEATCGTDGVKTFTCPDCNKTWTEKIPATGNHEWQGAECELQTCKNCTATRQGTAEHVWQGAECGEQTCKNCAATRQGTAEHVWEGEVCEEQTCKNCNATRPATAAHNYVPTSQAHPKEGETVDTDVYCNGDLYTDYVCTVCGDTYTSLSKPAKTHTVAEWENGELTPKEGAKCTYEGTRTGVCTDCGHTVNETYEVNGYHTYVTVITREATCTQKGEKTTRCSVCGDIKETVEFEDVNAHKWGEGVKNGNVMTFTCEHDPEHTKTSVVAEEGEKQLTVSQEDVKQAKELVVNNAAIEMDETAKESLPEGDLQFGVDTVDRGMIDPSLQETIGDKPVYDLTLGADGQPITEFNGGKVKVRIPYTLQDGEDVNSIVIWYVNGETIENVVGVYSNGYVEFETEHFSYYTVGKYTPEEMCHKYGHNLAIQKRDATCVLSGYDIEVCTRCGEVVKNEAEAPLGHKMARVEASCKAATCTDAGVTVEKCSVCNYQTEKIVPATGHKYQDTVTAATCTADGYTTHACSVCGQNYRDSFVPAKGHVWDIEAPTCTQGQKCTVCGESGLAALGHAYNTNGVCTRCGDGCTHNFEKGKVVPSTCTEKGYTVYTCTICGYSENRNETPLAEHNYKDGVCENCGAPAPVVYTEYEKILRSLKTEKYTISADDIAIFVRDGEWNGNRVLNIHLTDFEGALQFTKEGEIALRFTGSETYDSTESDTNETHNVSFDFILLNSVAYIKTTTDGSVEISCVPAEAMLANVPEPIHTVFATLLDPEALSGVLEKVSGRGDQIVSTVARFINGVFLRTETADGYKYTFDNSKVRELNKRLYEDSVSEVIDLYFGAGTFANLTSTLSDLLTVKKIPEAIDAIVEMAKNYDISREALFEAVDSILAMIAGEEGAPTIESIYGSEDMANVTVAEMIEASSQMEAGQFKAMFDRVVEMLENTSAYALIEQLSGGGSESDSGSGQTMPAEEGGIVVGERPTADFFYNLINAVFADDSITVSLTTDRESAVKSVGIDLGIQLNMLINDGSEKINVSGSIQIAVGSAKDVTVPNEFKVNDGIVTALKSLVNADPDKNMTVADGTINLAISEDGKLILTEIYTNLWQMDTSYDGEGNLVCTFSAHEYRYEFSDIDQLQISKSADCGASSRYYFRGIAQESFRQYTLECTYNKAGNILKEEITAESEEQTQGSSMSSCSFYYDSSTGEFFSRSQHKYQLDPLLSGSEDDVECGNYWEEVYVCSKCGDKRVESNYKSHSTYTVYSLVNKDGTCLDGLVRTVKCRVCGKELYSYTDMDIDYHPTTEMYVTIDTPHGEATFSYYGCPCGKEAQNFRQSAKDGCYFGVWDEYHGEIPDGHSIGVRRCAITGCTAYMVEDHWVEENGCNRDYYIKYTFFDGKGGTLGNSEGYLMQWHEVHHEPTIDHDRTELANGGYREVSRYHYECGHIADHTEIEEYHYDQFHRMTYYLRHRDYSDREDSYYEEKYTYASDDNCYYTSQYRRAENDPWKEGESGIRHGGNEEYYEPTCTQFGYWLNKCPACGYEHVSDIYEPRGHRYREGRCEDCGLENEQETDGVFILEDLTQREYVWGEDFKGDYVVGVWDPRALTSDSIISFYLVYLDENGEAQQIELQLDFEKYVRAQIEGESNSYMLIISGEKFVTALENAMQNAAESGWQEGWDFVGLRVTFLPTGTATQQAVSITLTEPPVSYAQA